MGGMTERGGEGGSSRQSVREIFTSLLCNLQSASSLKEVLTTKEQGRDDGGRACGALLSTTVPWPLLRHARGSNGSSLPHAEARSIALHFHGRQTEATRQREKEGPPFSPISGAPDPGCCITTNAPRSEQQACFIASMSSTTEPPPPLPPCHGHGPHEHISTRIPPKPTHAGDCARHQVPHGIAVSAAPGFRTHQECSR